MAISCLAIPMTGCYRVPCRRSVTYTGALRDGHDALNCITYLDPSVWTAGFCDVWRAQVIRNEEARGKYAQNIRN